MRPFEVIVRDQHVPLKSVPSRPPRPPINPALFPPPASLSSLTFSIHSLLLPAPPSILPSFRPVHPSCPPHGGRSGTPLNVPPSLDAPQTCRGSLALWLVHHSPVGSRVFELRALGPCLLSWPPLPPPYSHTRRGSDKMLLSVLGGVIG